MEVRWRSHQILVAASQQKCQRLYPAYPLRYDPCRQDTITDRQFREFSRRRRNEQTKGTAHTNGQRQVLQQKDPCFR